MEFSSLFSKVSLKPFQRLVAWRCFRRKLAASGNARSDTSRSAVALRRGRNSLIVRKRHRRGEFSPTAKRGGTAQVGGSPFYTKPFQIAYPLFSLAVEAQRKKLSKKEHAQERFRRVRAATNAPRVGWAVAFWKKRRKNFHTLSHLTVR